MGSGHDWGDCFCALSGVEEMKYDDFLSNLWVSYYHFFVVLFTPGNLDYDLCLSMSLIYSLILDNFLFWSAIFI